MATEAIEAINARSRLDSRPLSEGLGSRLTRALRIERKLPAKLRPLSNTSARPWLALLLFFDHVSTVAELLNRVPLLMCYWILRLL